MDELPRPLDALGEERQLLVRCLDALEGTRVPVERADLAQATALVAARYENVLADAFYPQIVDSLGTRSEVDRGQELLAHVRETVTRVRVDMRGVAPINAHVSDADGLETDIESMTCALRLLLDFENDELFQLVDQLDPSDAVTLRQRVHDVSAHQTSIPDPPDNAQLRKLAEVGENIALTWNDRPTAWHPGLHEVLNEPR